MEMIFMPEYTVTAQCELVLFIRLLISVICGMVIGWEREKRLKSAGLRTHMVVAMASALMMIISKYGFLDVVYLSSVQVDASRLAAGVVQAIGFLGQCGRRNYSRRSLGHSGNRLGHRLRAIFSWNHIHHTYSDHPACDPQEGT